MSNSSTAPILPLRRPHLYVVLLALSILTLAFLIGRTSVVAGSPQTLVAGLAADVLITLPAAYWLLLIRPGHVRRGTILPVIVLGYVLMSLIVPASRELPGLKWVFIALEPVLIGVVAWRINKFRKRVARSEATALPDRLGEVLTELVGSPRLAEIMSLELTALAYAVGIARRVPELRTGESHVTHHRRSGAQVALGAVVFICFVEVAVVHLLVSRWNTGMAWVLTILSVYAALWLVGYMRSLSLLPSTVGPRGVVLRNGLLENARFAPADVVGLQPHTEALAADPDYVAILPTLTQPTHVLEFAEPVVVHGLFGRRRTAGRIGIALDEPADFEQALKRD